MSPSRTKEREEIPAGSNGRSAGAQPSEPSLERAFAELGDAIGQLRILADVGSERVRLRLRRSLARLQSRLVLGVAMVLLAGAGTAFLAIGMLGACRALFAGRPWLGDLVAGAVLLAGVLAWARARRVLFERAELRRIEAKHEALEG